jgi:hypothetical protein
MLILPRTYFRNDRRPGISLGVSELLRGVTPNDLLVTESFPPFLWNVKKSVELSELTSEDQGEMFTCNVRGTGRTLVRDLRLHFCLITIQLIPSAGDKIVYIRHCCRQWFSLNLRG